MAPPGMADDAFRIPKASELIAAHLRQRIVHNDLDEDEALPSEASLLELFRVSRPTLREAYRILETEGLLTVKRGAHGGARVHKPRPDVAARYAAYVLESKGTPLKDVFAARELLEGPAIDMIGPAAPPDGLEQLREINERGQAVAGNLLASLAIHHEFHRALVDMAGNQTVSLLRDMIDLILEAAAERHVAAAGAQTDLLSSKKAQRTHERLVDLMCAGSLADAGQLWRSHLSDAARLVLASEDSLLHAPT
jgi:GntR family transcriptional repressor for pyruvate dehydrogenase complex